jgi:hypothetical protein
VNSFVLRILCFALVFAWASADAAPLNQVRVFAELTKDPQYNCGLDRNGLEAASEAVFRQNRVSIVAAERTPFRAYINVNAYRAVGDTCTYNLYFQVYFMGSTLYPSTGKNVFVPVEICSRSALLLYKSSDGMVRLNESIRSYTEQCLSEIEKIELR